MPLYDYQAEDGETRELFFHMTEEKPQTLELDGKAFERVWHAPQPNVRQTTHFVSRSLPFNYPHHKGEFDSQGRCLFDSRKEVVETTARAKDHGEKLEYDY